MTRQQENAERYRHRDSLAQRRGQQASLYVRDRQRGAETEQVLQEATLRDRQQKLEHARKRALDDENHMQLRERKQASQQNKLERGMYSSSFCVFCTRFNCQQSVSSRLWIAIDSKMSLTIYV